VDKVRVLKWIDDDWNFSVETRIGILSCVLDDDYKAWHAKWIFDDAKWIFDDADDSLGYFDTAAAAMDACESDYIARCSEFLRVAGPGECVVNAQYLRSLVDATCKDTCQAYESTQECETCWVELLRRDATAAIDAAGGEE